MKKIKECCFILTACLMLISTFFLGTLNAQTTEELEKKYAPILGVYNFDLNDLGLGNVGIRFFAEDNFLWAITDVSSEPGKMVPVEEKEFEFIIEDDEEGTYEIKFIKDNQGNYTKCQVKNTDMGMDVTGLKEKE